MNSFQLPWKVNKVKLNIETIAEVSSNEGNKYRAITLLSYILNVGNFYILILFSNFCNLRFHVSGKYKNRRDENLR